MDKNRCNELFKAFAHGHFMNKGSHEYDTAKIAFFYAFEQASQQPAGYKLVPTEPTDEMLEASPHGWKYDEIAEVYRAMIAAAPSGKEGE